MLKKINPYFILLFTVIFIYLYFSFYLKVTIWSFIYENSILEIYYTSKAYIKSLIFPLISFNLNLGFPIFAGSEGGTFEPLNLLSGIILDPIDQINFNYFSHLLLYSIGLFYLLNNVYKIILSVSLLSSFLIIFSNLNMTDAGHQYHIAVMSYLPITLILIEKYLLNNKFLIFFIFFPLIISFQNFAGHFQYQLYCFILITAYFSLSIILNSAQSNKIKKIILFFCSFLLGFILSAPQLIPSYDLMLLGDRANFDNTYTGSLGFSSLAIFYRPLLVAFNGIIGSISTIGYLIIFIYSLQKILDFIIDKKIYLDKMVTKIFLVFIFMFLIGLGDNFFLNKFIYKIIPLLDSFRFPSRIMQINSLCTVIIFAISLNELFKFKFNLKNLNLIFIIIFVLYFLTFAHFYKYIIIGDRLNLENLSDIIIIFYPFLLIIFLYYLIKYFRAYTFHILLSFFLINTLESFLLIKHFETHTFLVKKDIIKSSQEYASELCRKNNISSLNIVGHLDKRKYFYKLNSKDLKLSSILTSDSCKVQQHHERKEVTSKGLGYNHSSLTPGQMIYLSKYQEKFQNEQDINYDQNKSKNIASMIQYFVKSKTLYEKSSKSISEKLLIFDSSYIDNFIKGYNYKEEVTLIDKIRIYFQPFLIRKLNNSNYYADFFPKISKDQIKNINYGNFIFLPLWQSSDYYYKDDNKFYKLKKFSFGHQIPVNLNTFDIYYVPISFVLGLLSLFFGLTILLITLFYFFIIKNFKNNSVNQ